MATGAFQAAVVAVGRASALEEVVIAEEWVEPGVGEAHQRTVTTDERSSMYRKSPCRSVRVDGATRREVKSALNDGAFRDQAEAVYEASVGAKWEMGALRVHEVDGTYYVYSVGTPDSKVANRMLVRVVDPSLGRHVFNWHPHPWRNPAPSPADLCHSYRTGVPGAIMYGRRPAHTIYQGGCKRGRSC